MREKYDCTSLYTRQTRRMACIQKDNPRPQKVNATRNTGTVPLTYRDSGFLWDRKKGIIPLLSKIDSGKHLEESAAHPESCMMDV